MREETNDQKEKMKWVLLLSIAVLILVYFLLELLDSSANDSDECEFPEIGEFELSDSKILTNQSDIDTFHDLLKQQFNEAMNWYDFTATLLYRYTEDGKLASDFHGKCDGHNNTIILIKSHDHVCGGFTSINWGLSAGHYQDPNAFLFLLTNPWNNESRIFEQKPNTAVGGVSTDQRVHPAFGMSVLYSDSVLDDEGTADLNITSWGYGWAHSGIGYEGDGKLCGGTTWDGQLYNFQITEYEVFLASPINCV